MHLVRRACLFDVLLSTLRRQLQWSLDEGPQALRSQAYHRVLSDIKVALVPEAAVFLLSDATPVDTLGPWDGRVAPWQGHAGGVGQVDADTAPWARSAFDHLDRSALEDMCRVPLSHVQQAGQKLASVDAAQNGLGGLLGAMPGPGSHCNVFWKGKKALCSLSSSGLEFDALLCAMH